MSRGARDPQGGRSAGTVETHRWQDGRTITYRARFRAYGTQHRITFGTNHQGWSTERARVELDKITAQVERGTWQPPQRGSQPEPERERETLHVTASRWWQRRHSELAPTTQADYRWRLDFILRKLAATSTAELDVRQVDAFRAWLQSKGLSPRSVNMVLDLLAQILDDAVEYELLAYNPARGKRRRMKVAKTARTFLEPDMVVDLLDAAGAWEAELPEHQHYGRRALLAALCLAGPRIAEILQTPRGQLDLVGGSLVLGLKTPAGRGRHIDLTATLRDELEAHLAATARRSGEPHRAHEPVFLSRARRPLNASNIRNRLLAEVVLRANTKRAGEGRLLLPERVTPHTLRRTFASLSIFAGRDLRYLMGQLGHDDPRMTLAVYAQTMKRRDIDEQLVWRLMRFADEPKRAPRGRRSGTRL